MTTIKQLPQSVINKIAAGEVVERPASVVKELTENAVDAGSGRVDVAVAKGGVDLIRVADNGCGIAPDELTLAVASHATSKIGDAEDLFSVRTLGFRGEALASIAEVSHALLRSRTASSSAGCELEIHGGQLQPVAPCGCPTGTIVEVRNLFFNTPVRRKFMRTTNTELSHCSEAFTRIALAHDNVHFTFSHNDRLIYEMPPTDSWLQRIATVCGRELAESLMWVEADEGAVQIHGYVANPTQSRGNNRMQYLFLNGRHIRDRALGHALGEAYRGLLLTGRYPIAFLRITMAPELVDVNVHPTKLEVRFQDSGQVYSSLLGMLRSRFLTTDLTARVGPTASDPPVPPSPAPPLAGVDAGVAEDRDTRDEFSQWVRQQSPVVRNGNEGPGAARCPGTPDQRDLGLTFSGRPGPTLCHVPSDQAEESLGTSPEGTPALQLHNRYLVTETPDGMIVIDQHALHERIIYEEIREKVLRDVVEKQPLLVPETVHLTAAEAAAILEQRETLAQLGIDMDSFGGDTVVISSYPAMLANLEPSQLVRQMAEQLVSHDRPPTRRELLDELLHMISCKAAVKAGDRLTREEISALIGRRELVQDAHHCPHGRPTTLVFTREELDRRFKRI